MEDSKIVALYWERSEKAIRQTEETYGRYALSIAENVLGSREDAEECANDAYMKLWDTIPPERPTSLKLYLAAVIRNLALHRRRSQNAAKRGGGQYTVVWEEMADTIPVKEGVEELWEASWLSELLNRFLDRLPREKRLMFLMRYWYFDPIDRIAEALGVSKSKVKMTLLRTRGELKEYLRKEGINL